MKVLLHICCANCAIYPVLRIREGGNDVVGFFFNPNIHPYQEYIRRLESVRKYAEEAKLEVIYKDEYLLEEFLKAVAHRYRDRCSYCYSMRLDATARKAKEMGFDMFSTTLLQSTHQNHFLIKETAERISEELNIPFYYEDFRAGWREGVKISRLMGLYRQQYCGCIYSEKERFCKKT